MKKTMNPFRIVQILLTSLLSCSLLLVSCSIERNEDIRERNADIETLGTALTMLTDLRDNSAYGTAKGQYPEESKDILDDAMAALGRLIFDIDSGTSIYQSEIEQALSDADKATDDFKATVRTASVFYAAELYVNGTDGGYIDFGIEPGYSRFGEDGNQEFTVEVRVKLSGTSGFGTIVSTYLEDSDDPRYRKGWMINHYNNDFMRMSYGLNDYNLWEPGDGFTRLNEWAHIAAVYCDSGVDGDMNGTNPVVIKYYINGELKRTVENGNPGSVYYNAADDKGKAMTAFVQFDKNGNRNREVEGYIKDFRIWKSAKSQAQINDLMNKAVAVTGNESDLVCAWSFDSTVENDKAIPDLTGNYTASVQGNYQWILTE